MKPAYDVTAVLPYYYPETTGHCQSFNSLLPYLGRGLRTAVVTCNRMYSATSSPLAARQTHQGVDIYRVRVPVCSRASAGAHLAHAMRFVIRVLPGLMALRARSVFCITSPPFLYALLSLLCRVRKTPLVLWAMDLYPETLAAMGLINAEGSADRALRRAATAGYRRCERIFTLGPVMSGRIRRLGIEARKIIAVHNWVPEELQRVPRPQNRWLREQGLGDRFIVQYSGNMGLVHSFDILLSAARRLAAHAPEVLMMLIGSGPQRAELESRVRELGLRNVQIRDYTPFQRLSESLSAADLSFASIGRGMEGVIAPGKIYAALKVGTPVALVQERQSDLSRVVGDRDVEGLILKPDDVDGLVRYVLTLKSDPVRLRQARRRNMEWYRQHCALEVNAARFRAEFQSLLADGLS